MKEVLENLKNMLEFPNLQCSQNAVTAVGNLLVAIHKMGGLTAVETEKQMILNGKKANSAIKFSLEVHCSLRIRSFVGRISSKFMQYHHNSE